MKPLFKILIFPIKIYLMIVWVFLHPFANGACVTDDCMFKIRKALDELK